MSCRHKAMNYLARREHSRAELSRKLQASGFDLDEIETTLDQLTADSLLDDLRYAESYTRSRINRGFGPIRIQHELCERGVSKVIAEEVLSAWSGRWLQLAREQQRKKYPQTATNYQEKAKQARFLQYRGFTSEQIRQAVDDTVSGPE